MNDTLDKLKDLFTTKDRSISKTFCELTIRYGHVAVLTKLRPYLNVTLRGDSIFVANCISGVARAGYVDLCFKLVDSLFYSEKRLLAYDLLSSLASIRSIDLTKFLPYFTSCSKDLESLSDDIILANLHFISSFCERYPTNISNIGTISIAIYPLLQRQWKIHRAATKALIATLLRTENLVSSVYESGELINALTKGLCHSNSFTTTVSSIRLLCRLPNPSKLALSKLVVTIFGKEEASPIVVQSEEHAVQCSLLLGSMLHHVPHSFVTVLFSKLQKLLKVDDMIRVIDVLFPLLNDFTFADVPYLVDDASFNIAIGSISRETLLKCLDIKDVTIAESALKNLGQLMSKVNIPVDLETEMAALLEELLFSNVAHQKISLAILSSYIPSFTIDQISKISSVMYNQISSNAKKDLLEATLVAYSNFIESINDINTISPTPAEVIARLTSIFIMDNDDIRFKALKLLSAFSRREVMIAPQEWLRQAIQIIELFSNPSRSYRIAAINTFIDLMNQIPIFELISLLLKNLGSADRLTRKSSISALSIISEKMGSYSVLPVLLAEYRVPSQITQISVLQTLHLIFLTENNLKYYFVSCVTLLDSALTDRDSLHRQLAAKSVGVAALKLKGQGFDNYFIHFLNYLLPNLIDVSDKDFTEDFIEASARCSIAIGAPYAWKYLEVGINHPAKKVNRIYREIFSRVQKNVSSWALATTDLLDIDPITKQMYKDIDLSGLKKIK